MNTDDHPADLIHAHGFRCNHCGSLFLVWGNSAADYSITPTTETLAAAHEIRFPLL